MNCTICHEPIKEDQIFTAFNGGRQHIRCKYPEGINLVPKDPITFQCRFCGKGSLDYIVWARGYHTECELNDQKKRLDAVISPIAHNEGLDINLWADRPEARKGLCPNCGHPTSAHRDASQGSAWYCCSAFSVKNGNEEDEQCLCRGPFDGGGYKTLMFISEIDRYLEEWGEMTEGDWKRFKKKYGIRA